MKKKVDNIRIVEENTTAVIYARYSSHNQRDVSIEQQVAECEDYARRLGLTVLRTYADRALSGTTDKRPQFQQMLRDAAHGHWGYVICYKIDRFARNRYDSATYKYKLKKAGCKVIYAKESIPDGPEGILLESVLEGSAEYYSENLAQNVRRGMAYNAENCKVCGTLPFGFCKGPDSKYAIEPAEAEIVREIFRRYVSGEQLVSVAADLNRRGIRTRSGKEWGRCSFQHLLKNENYIGVYTYCKSHIEGGVPAIVEREEFDRAQAMMGSRKQAHGRHTEYGDYLLTGKLICGECGEHMVGASSTGQHGELHFYYICMGRTRKHNGCKKKNVRRQWIEDLVVNAVREHLLRDDIVEWIADRAMDYQRTQQESAQVSARQAELDDLTHRHDNILAAIEQGVVSAGLTHRLQKLEAEITLAEGAVRLAEASVTRISRPDIIAWLYSFRADSTDDPAFRRRLIDTFISTVKLYDDRLIIGLNYTGPTSTLETPLSPDLSAEDSECVQCVTGTATRLLYAPPAGLFLLVTL